MKSAEKMRTITQHVERSSQEQARGGRQITRPIENISNMVNQLNASHKRSRAGSEQLLAAAAKIEGSATAAAAERQAPDDRRRAPQTLRRLRSAFRCYMRMAHTEWAPRTTTAPAPA